MIGQITQRLQYLSIGKIKEELPGVKKPLLRKKSNTKTNFVNSYLTSLL